jgi:DNA invertase Pin-like site-specific DNA recombinase
MTRVALYARYSSDNQSETSIEDQFRICQEQAKRERWSVTGNYQDAAISGANLSQRPGIQTLLQDAAAGKFDMVLAEALDRISRDQADIATLYKHLRFAGVAIVTLADGEISELHIGLKGTMNALFLKDLADKTRRGLRGRVEKGKSGGGLCYGYRVAKKLDRNGDPIRGEREIVESEAETVRRIFREFSSGKSPKAIAVDLNREGVPGPLGRAWGDTSIRGHVSRGTGILNNELYVGVLVWNRQRFIKDPATGNRVSRPNPLSAWIRKEAPELRIVQDDLWLAVRARQLDIAKLFETTTLGVREARAKKLHAARRPVSLLSGLLTCGCCQGRFGLVLRDRYGCLNHYRRGACDNNRTIRREIIERRVLSGLTERMASPDAVAEAVRTYHEENNRLNHERRAQAEADRRALEKIDRGVAGILAAIEDGMYQPVMKARMEELERQRTGIMARIAEAPADLPDVHPNLSNIYRAKVARLADALNDPDAAREAAEAIRALIGEVVVTPGEKRGQVHATLRGELIAILDIAGQGGKPPNPPVMTNAAARPRNHRNRHSGRRLGRSFLALGRPFEDCAKVALQRGDDLSAFGTRPERDALDERADSLGSLVSFLRAP